MPSAVAPARRPVLPSRASRALGIFALITALFACDSSAGGDLVVAGEDCSYSGPTTLEPGPATVALHLTSLGHNEVIVASLEEGRTHPELVAFLDEAADPINDRPTWITEIVTLELEHHGGEREGINEDFEASEGTYSLICIDHWGFEGAGPTARTIAEISVSSP